MIYIRSCLFQLIFVNLFFVEQGYQESVYINISRKLGIIKGKMIIFYKMKLKIKC